MNRIIAILIALIVTQATSPQEIQIKRFERNYNSLIARVEPMYDNNGDGCAVIRFFVSNTDFVIDPNMGVVKGMVLPGEIRLYVPKGTKRLTVKLKGLMPLKGYEIPVEIESKATYEAELSVSDEVVKRDKANKEQNAYVGAGYHIMSLSGPSVSLGFNIAHHNIEVGAVFGMKKTDDIYFYDSNYEVGAAYNYKSTKLQLSYGYEIKATDFLSLMPQIGGAYTIISGSEVMKGNSSSYKDAKSMSVMIAARMLVSFSNTFKLHITPEYDFGAYKDNSCKTLTDFDSTLKSWTDGFNLNVGLMYFF